MLSEVSQAQKVKDRMFSLIQKCTYRNIYDHTYIYIYIYIYSDRENKIVLVSLSEGTTGGGREKEYVRE
jgi:hypothetical protein